MSDWKKYFKELEEKIMGYEDIIQNKLKDLDKAYEDKVEVIINKFVKDKEKARKGENDGKAVYEYHANGFVTRVFKDGTKTVTPEENGRPDKKESVKQEKTKGDKILGIIPFLDKDSLHELTVKFIDGELEIEMREVLPFLDEDDIALLMKKITENNGEPFKGLELSDLLPFADEDEIGEIFKQRAKEGIIDETLINYVDDDCWHEIVVDYCENENSELDIDKIYPHLDEDDLKLLFKTYLKRQK